eukprot:s502_g8.t1
MAEDLRGALKKYTKNRGISLPVVKAYTKQLLVGVRHMHKFNIIHADLKPDNILISQDNSIVKLCDFGTAVEQRLWQFTAFGVPELRCPNQSRFYRPSEVILGCEYGIPVDVWALACTLYEIFTGKTLFQGKTNNDMLKRIMDVKGKIPKNVIRKGAVWKNHFDENLDFKRLGAILVVESVKDGKCFRLLFSLLSQHVDPFVDKDALSGEEIVRIVTDNSCKRELKDPLYVKKTLHFADLLDKMLALDPDKRLSAEDALKHHFVEDPREKKAAAAAAPNASGPTQVQPSATGRTSSGKTSAGHKKRSER